MHRTNSYFGLTSVDAVRVGAYGETLTPHSARLRKALNHLKRRVLIGGGQQWVLHAHLELAKWLPLFFDQIYIPSAVQREVCSKQRFRLVRKVRSDLKFRISEEVVTLAIRMAPEPIGQTLGKTRPGNRPNGRQPIEAEDSTEREEENK